eukprot:190736_1
MNTNISICVLCGFHQKDSIVLKLRNRPTFLMLNEIDEFENNNNDFEEKLDDIDSMIQSSIKHKLFNLVCPNKNDNIHCPSMLRLAKMLILYKRWIHTVYKKTKGNGNIEKTIRIDIEKYISNDTFKLIFVKNVKSMSKIDKQQQEILIQMFEDNVDDICNLTRFLNTTAPAFAEYIRRYTTTKLHSQIKAAHIAKLFRKTKNILKKETQTKQFGLFLSEANMKNINKDYYHILNAHVNNGDKTTIKNTFLFFNHVVHYDDDDNPTECKSVTRREQRKHYSKQGKIKEIKTESEPNEMKHVWELKQYYHQNQLDMIHSHLVHSKWQFYVQRFANQHSNDDEINIVEEELQEDDLQNENKYITDLSESNVSSYGFGIDYSYPHLSP